MRGRESTDVMENEPRSAPHTIAGFRSLLERVVRAPRWMYWAYTLWPVVFLSSSIMGCQRCLTPIRVGVVLVPTMDCAFVIWRALFDKQLEVYVRAIAAAVTAIGTVLARSFALSLVAESLGADPHAASSTADLLTLLSLPLFVASVPIMSVFLVMFFVLGSIVLPAMVASLTYLATPDHVRTVVYWGIGLMVAPALIVELRKHFLRPASVSRRSSHSWRLVGWRFTNWLLAVVCLGAVFAGAAMESRPLLVAGVRMVAALLDFRAPAECVMLNATHPGTRAVIASIPNVDDAVLVARQPLGLGSVTLLNPFAGIAPIVITRERCVRQNVGQAADP
jgi:hypothetical protein